jgi:diguanylate cyclase (GGDEF)-like protein
VARTDELTGLPNRRALNEQLPARMQAASRHRRVLCLAMLDLDNFKAFNDDRGHQEGDRLLQASAVAWRGELRDEDLLARYGGEEFTVILDAPVHQAREILERLRAATPMAQTCSVGLTQWDRHESPEVLIARADDALYRAKHAGRDRIELAVAPV